jgi:L-alanine-DL-glutamate epimerase-like enolase superfamily enzyme
MHRRDVLKTSVAALLGVPNIAAGAPYGAPSGPPKIRITDVKLLRLRFPGKTARKRNSILWSGGGAPGMTQLEIHTDAGIVGRSIPAGFTNIVLENLAPLIRGENPFFVEKLWDKMYRSWRKPVAKGAVIQAIGAVDIALWDIIGKALNMPVYHVLGAFSDTLRVYAAGGYYEDGKGLKELAREMEGYVGEGFRAVKMKVGGEAFATDVERVRAVREAVGPKVDLLIDANNKWNAYEAIRFGRAVEKYDPFWFEEPVEPDDFKGCAEVRAALDMPVVAGENEFTRWGCRELLEARSADILNLDTVIAGGITEYRKIAGMASAWHVPVAPHGNPHMAVHLMAATSNALIVETYPGVESKYNPALPLYPVKDGYIKVPDTPGLGIDPDPELVKKYKVG